VFDVKAKNIKPLAPETAAPRPASERLLRIVPPEGTARLPLAGPLKAHLGHSEFRMEQRIGRWVPQAAKDFARSWASQRILMSTGIKPEQINQLKAAMVSDASGVTQFSERARVLMEENILRPRATLKTIEEDATTRAEVHRQRIDGMVSELDGFLAQHPQSANLRPDPLRIAERIRTELISKLNAPPDFELKARLEHEANAIEAMGRLTFGQGQELKRSYDRHLNWGGDQSEIQKELMKVRHIVNQETERNAEALLKEIDPEKHGQFRDAKVRYAHLKRTGDVAKAARIVQDTQRNDNASNIMIQVVSVLAAAGFGWLAGLLIGYDPHATAAVSGALGSAPAAVKLVEMAADQLGSNAPSTVAPWVYNLLDRMEGKAKVP